MIITTNNLFLYDKNDTYLKGVGVQLIKWGKTVEETIVVLTSGYEQSSLKFLSELPSGETLRIVHIPDGKFRDDINNGTVYLTLRNCEVKSRFFRDPVLAINNRIDPVLFRVVLRCQLRWGG